MWGLKRMGFQGGSKCCSWNSPSGYCAQWLLFYSSINQKAEVLSDRAFLLWCLPALWAADSPLCGAVPEVLWNWSELCQLLEQAHTDCRVFTVEFAIKLFLYYVVLHVIESTL